MSLNQEVINCVYKNAHVALQSISDLLPEVDNKELRDELVSEYDGYEKLIGEISEYMADKDYKPKDIGPMKKAMLYTAIKMNAIKDDSKSHFLEMMIKGTVMGICELRELIDKNHDKVDIEVLEYAKRLLALEEQFEERLKKLFNWLIDRLIGFCNAKPDFLLKHFIKHKNLAWRNIFYNC